MKFIDVINRAAEIVGAEPNFEEMNAAAKKLIACGRLVYGELTAEYVRVVQEEDIAFADAKAEFTAFSKPVKEILSIVKDGVRREFKAFPAYVSCQITGKAKVRYAYHCDEPELHDELVLPSQFTPAMLATGVAGEYYYRGGLLEEAVFYKNRYDTSVINQTRRQKPLELKVERFL